MVGQLRIDLLTWMKKTLKFVGKKIKFCVKRKLKVLHFRGKYPKNIKCRKQTNLNLSLTYLVYKGEPLHARPGWNTGNMLV